ncbi:unnamed protein product, partial [Callosobruchus maculatus]
MCKSINRKNKWALLRSYYRRALNRRKTLTIWKP